MTGMRFTNMVRGCEKRIFYVKNPGGDVFDEAYFILRKRSDGSLRDRGATPREIQLEAMRIAEGAISAVPRFSHGKREKLRAFIAGAAVSAISLGIVGTVLWFVLTSF